MASSFSPQTSLVARAVGFVALGLVLGVAATVALQFAAAPARSMRSLSVGRQPTRRAVVGQGTLQPRLGPVQIGSPLAGFQIQKIAVQAGDSVKAGAVLVQLDPAAATYELAMAQAQKKDALQRQEVEKELAEQRLEAAQLSVRQGEESRGVELQAQQKQVEVAELKVAQAETDLQQLTTLSGGEDPIIPAQKVNQQQLLKQLSLAERDAADVSRKRTQQSVQFQAQRAASEQRAATSALNTAKMGTPLELFDSRIALAELKVNQTKVAAPFAGTVLNVLAHPGELVTPQPLLEIANLEDMICVVEVDVSDAPLLRAGQTATITSPAFHGATVTGAVEHIGVGAGAPALRQLDPRQSVDRTVTKVKLRIEAGDAVRALGGAANSEVVLVGLRVDVEFALPKEPAGE